MDVIDVERRLQELRRLPVAEPPPIDELAGRGQRQRERRRRVEFAMGAVAAVALVVVGLIVRSEGAQDAVVTSGRAESTPATSGPTTTMSVQDALAAWDEAMVAELAAFASRPSDETFNDLPLAQFVLLGIGDRTVYAKAEDELRDPSVWVVEGHSVLDLLAAEDGKVQTRNPHEACIAEHPVPPEMAPYRRLSIYPTELKGDACLNWYSVDLYIQDGKIAGISLNLWEG